MRTTLVLDALRMALHQRGPGADVELVHHSDRGSQYTSIDYSQELADHHVLASVGSVGDAQLELAIVEWIGWFNSVRLHSALDDRPPLEFEQTALSRTTVQASPATPAHRHLLRLETT